MNWKAREYYFAPMLEEGYLIKTPDHFYRSFALVFGGITNETDAYQFIRHLNQMMKNRKGGGKLLKREILAIRGEGYDVTEHTSYNRHHVTPSSRDHRHSEIKSDKEIVKLPENFHAAWHGLFCNLYGEEVLIFLNKLFYFLSRKEAFEYSEYNIHVESAKRGKLSRV